MQQFIPLIARAFLAAIFIKSGTDKLLDPAGTQQYMASAGLPLTGLLLAGAIVAELAGAISVILGWKARWGAIALIVFLVPATLIFHTDFSQRMQLLQFLKNLGLIGGLLMVVAYGSGPLSLDERLGGDRKGEG